MTNRFKSSTKNLIDRHGQTRVYESISSEVHNLNTQMTEAVVVLHTIKMFKTEPNYRETRSPNLVERNASVFLIASKDLTVQPKVGDKIRDTLTGVDSVLEVISFTQYEGFGDVCLYRVMCISA